MTSAGQGSILATLRSWVFVAVCLGAGGLLIRFGPGMVDPHDVGRPEPLRALGYAVLVLAWLCAASLEWIRGHRRMAVELQLVAVVLALGALIVSRVPWQYTLGSMVTTAAAPLAIHVLLRYPDVPLGRWDRLIVASGVVGTLSTVPIHLFYAPQDYGCPSCPVGVNALFWQRSDVVVNLALAVGGAGIVGALMGAGIVAISRHRSASRVSKRIVRPVSAATLALVAGIVAFLVDQNASVDTLAPLQARSGVGGAAVLVAGIATPAALLVARARERNLALHLAHLDVTLDGSSLERGLQELVDDPLLRVGVRSERDSIRGLDGRPLELPGDRDPHRTVTALADVGVMVHDRALLDERGVMAPLVVVAALAIKDHLLAEEVTARLAEVQAAQGRLVAASDAARRQVERDLHDGAQQRLVTAGLRLRTLREELRAAGGGRGGSPDVVGQLDVVTAELQAALVELRELARGIFPTLLSRGLRPAVEDVVRRSPLPVATELRLPRRLPPAVELTAFFVVAEGLTNVAKHSGGSARVDIEDDGEHLVVVVSDDGVGGADPTGSGLTGLADRVQAVGGSFTVRSDPEHGTELLARLPFVELSQSENAGVTPAQGDGGQPGPGGDPAAPAPAGAS